MSSSAPTSNLGQPPATVEDVPETEIHGQQPSTIDGENVTPVPVEAAQQVSDNGNPFLPDATTAQRASDASARRTTPASSGSLADATSIPLPPSDMPTPSSEAEQDGPDESALHLHERERFAYSSVGPFTSSSTTTPPTSTGAFASSSIAPSTAVRSLADQAARGMPRLSGPRPAPVVESDSCRTCGKLFLPLFRKAHACGHCGYQYCENDCDQKALLPRRSPAVPPSSAGTSSGVGGENGPLQGGGYELVEVCGNCFPMLQVTSGHPPYLRSLPLKRLQHYTKAYGLNTSGAIEKEDFVQTILKARTGPDGCLPPEAETYYRRRSVPKQGILPSDQSANGHARPNAPSSSSSATNAAERAFSNAANSFQNVTNNVSNMFREATGQSASQQQPSAQQRPTSTSTPPPRSQPGQYRPAPNQGNSTGRVPPSYAQQQQQQYRPASGFAPRPQAPRPTPTSTAGTSRPATKPAAAKPAPRPPSPPVPTINSLVALPTSYISTLSIGTLKAILYENHVKVDFSQILEKGELARRVAELVREERKRLERQARAEEAEAAAEAARANGHLVPPDANGVAEGEDHPSDGEGRKSTDQPRAPAVPTGPQATPERDGLCVVCQDAEAQLAVVDCGHLAMCADCSKLVMATSRECPLCRTRIVTEQRLIRIFRT